MKIEGGIIRKGHDMRRAYDGTMYSDYEKYIPFAIVADEGDPLTIEIVGKQYPYLHKTINRDGSIEIHERYTYRVRIYPVAGTIKEVVFPGLSTISSSGIAVNSSGFRDCFGSCAVEFFYAKPHDAEVLPERDDKLTTWDRRSEEYVSFTTAISHEEYTELKDQGEALENERQRRLDAYALGVRNDNESASKTIFGRIKEVIHP
ncbi:MAG: hypothetical protein WC520_03995 [Candidatus Paceibacterota bacterium]